MARQTIVSTQQAERITDRALRHIRPIFGKCYGYPDLHNCVRYSISILAASDTAVRCVTEAWSGQGNVLKTDVGV